MINLFTGLKVKNKVLKNRVVLPPLVRFSLIGKDGYVTDELVEWYEEIAKNGVGMIVVEATCVAEDGKLRDNQLGIWNDSFIEGLSKISDLGKKYNVPMLLQLHHYGFKEKISEVKTEILDDILIKFIDGVERAKKTGFDGIELHGAHTYLLSQLASRVWNVREDRYGGSFEKRMYFVTELIERTRKYFDGDFILGYRMGGNEPLLDDGIEIAKYLERLGVDILHISFGVPDPEKKQEIKIDLPSDFEYDWVVYLGVKIKEVVNIPVIGVRNIKTELQASSLIENKMLDLVAIGRAMISRPNWIGYAKKEYEKRTGKLVVSDADE